MANVLHRTTNKYLQSVNTADYPVGDWIINPDLSSVGSFASTYWIITGDVVTLMDQAARDAVDAANDQAARDGVFAEVDDIESLVRATILVLRDEINLLRSEHSLAPRTLAQVRAGIQSKLGAA